MDIEFDIKMFQSQQQQLQLHQVSPEIIDQYLAKRNRYLLLLSEKYIVSTITTTKKELS